MTDPLKELFEAEILVDRLMWEELAEMPDLQSPDEDWLEDELDLDKMSGSFEDVDTDEDEILLEDFVAQLEMEGDCYDLS